MDWFLSHLSDILLTASVVVSSAAAIAALTPTPTDDSIIGMVRKVVDFLAMNFGNARNRE